MDMNKNQENEETAEYKNKSKAKKIMRGIVGLLVLILVVDNINFYRLFNRGENNDYVYHWEEPARLEIHASYTTFEEALRAATDVVVAQYVGSRSFGEFLTEFEFEVSDRIRGESAERIFIYVENGISISMGKGIVYRPADITFTEGIDYLLPLSKITDVYMNTHNDGFMLIVNIVIDLDELSNSTMYNQPLARHSWMINFNSSMLSRRRVISRVRMLTMFNAPADDFIRSELLEDIINDSPYILVIEISEVRWLSGTSDWMSIDTYYVTIIESLKGDIVVDGEIVIVFFADTVSVGDRHIVAVEPINEGSMSFDFTSRNSLFSMDQLDEILEIIENEN